MGYFSGIGDMLGVAADAKKRQAQMQPPPFQGGPPQIAGMMPGAANSGPMGADDMMEMSDVPTSHGPPMGGIPGAPSEVPRTLTIGGLRDMLSGGGGPSQRPFGGYYATPTNLEGLGGGLAQALENVRQQARNRLRSGGR
jgi:hypothetical protein